jgi:hypothetical protein
VLISELDHLPEQRRKHSLQVERDFLAQCEQLLDQAAPESDPAEQKITIRAVLNVVETVARTRRLATRADIADRLAEIGTAMLLGLPAHRSRSESHRHVLDPVDEVGPEPADLAVQPDARHSLR